MGVYYSAGFGYGIKLTNGNLPAGYEGGIGEYLDDISDELRSMGLGYVALGNEYSGSSCYVLGHVVSLHDFDAEPLSLPQPTPAEKHALESLALARGWSAPGWYGGMYVY